MTCSDSEYEYIESETDNSSIEEEEIDMEFEDEDWEDLYEMISELVYDSIHENIIHMSNANIYKEIINHVMDVVHETLGHIFEEESVYIDIQELVEQIMDIEMVEIPRRSLTMTIDTLEYQSVEEKERIGKLIKGLREVPQPQQKTKEWYEFRYNLLSASNLWKVFGSDAQRNSLIYEKCKPLDMNIIGQSNSFTGSSMHWGVKYEPITVMVYEDMYQTTVEEFGCIEHPEYNYVGASPDGINVDTNNNRYGRMLEIKNIVNRDITGVPKMEYWTQTQIQMETCNLEECDFAETRFKEYNQNNDFYEDNKPEYKGVIIHFIERPILNTEFEDISQVKSSTPIYVYKPLNIGNEKEVVEEWVNNKKIEMNENGYAWFNTIYWYLDEFSCVLIQRNRKWFEKAVLKIEELWNIVKKERVDGYEHRAAKKRRSSTNELNTIPKPGICLIRLDENGNII